MVIEKFEAIGFVEAMRPHAEDDFWGGEEARITLTGRFTADAPESAAFLTERHQCQINFPLAERPLGAPGLCRSRENQAMSFDEQLLTLARETGGT